MRNAAIILLAGNGLALVVASGTWGVPAYLGGLLLLGLAAWIAEKTQHDQTQIHR